MNQALSAALSYGARGWRVLPVIGKIPTLRDWPTKASIDPEQIRAWWIEQPMANVGIATGTQSQLLVLDVDPDKGGDDSLRKLEAQHGPLPMTIEVITGGGGHHYYFQHSGIALRNSAGKLGSGLDIRTEGGQVVAPPPSTLTQDASTNGKEPTIPMILRRSCPRLAVTPSYREARHNNRTSEPDFPGREP